MSVTLADIRRRKIEVSIPHVIEPEEILPITEKELVNLEKVQNRLVTLLLKSAVENQLLPGDWEQCGWVRGPDKIEIGLRFGSVPDKTDENS